MTRCLAILSWKRWETNSKCCLRKSFQPTIAKVLAWTTAMLWDFERHEWEKLMLLVEEIEKRKNRSPIPGNHQTGESKKKGGNICSVQIWNVFFKKGCSPQSGGKAPQKESDGFSSCLRSPYALSVGCWDQKMIAIRRKGLKERKEQNTEESYCLSTLKKDRLDSQNSRHEQLSTS